jgi:hypothetical protein
LGGIRVADLPSSGVSISGSNIGVDLDGLTGVGNGGPGILLERVEGSFIQNSLIGDNAGSGIEIVGPASNNTGFQILTNNVGVGIDGDTPLGNTQAGIQIRNGIEDVAIRDNYVANNLVGIAVQGNTTNNVSIRQNQIWDNTELGIDLGWTDMVLDGVTPNDTNDNDSGPNSLMNFPVLTSIAHATGGLQQWETNWTFDGNNTDVGNHVIQFDFFATPISAETHGEGKRYIKSITTTANGLGDASFSVMFNSQSELLAAEALTAVAIDRGLSGTQQFGNSSEFSAATRTTDSAPTVVEVIVSNSDLMNEHAPYSVPDGNEQIKTVPIGGGIDTITIEFSEAVNVDLDDITVLGQSTTYSLDSYVVSGGGTIVTWTLDSTGTTDQICMHLNASGASPITSVAGNIVLDGEWNNPLILNDAGHPGDTFNSGDGTAGGDFEFWFTILPGDANAITS